MSRGVARRFTLPAIVSLTLLQPPAAAPAVESQQTRKVAPPAKPRATRKPSPTPTPRPRPPAAALESQAGPSESDVARLARVRARREAVEREILKLQKESDSTLGELDAIDLDLRLAAHRLDEATLEFKETSRRLDATLRDVKNTRDKIEITRPRVLKSLVALSKLGELSYARLLFSLDDPADVLRGYRYVSRIATADSDQINEFRASLTRLSGLEEQLKERTARNLETRSRLNEAKRSLTVQKEAKETRIWEIVKRQELQEKVAAEYQQREEDLLEILRRSGEEPPVSQSARPQAPPITPLSNDRPLGARKGELSWPVQGALVKKFGLERDPRFGTRTIQQGIEIDAFPEVEVHAVHPGRVVFADHFVGYGMLVIIDHGHREHTLYGRLGELLVSPGDDVAEGSLLGLLPDTRVTGGGLHFEVRVQGKPEDPLDWLKRP